MRLGVEICRYSAALAQLVDVGSVCGTHDLTVIPAFYQDPNDVLINGRLSLSRSARLGRTRQRRGHRQRAGDRSVTPASCAARVAVSAGLRKRGPQVYRSSNANGDRARSGEREDVHAMTAVRD